MQAESCAGRASRTATGSGLRRACTGSPSPSPRRRARRCRTTLSPAAVSERRQPPAVAPVGLTETARGGPASVAHPRRPTPHRASARGSGALNRIARHGGEQLVLGRDRRRRRLPPRTGCSSLWRSTIGKKYVAAVTGVLLAGFVIAHMLGNLKAIEGPGTAMPASTLRALPADAGSPVLPHDLPVDRADRAARGPDPPPHRGDAAVAAQPALEAGRSARRRGALDARRADDAVRGC